MSNRGASSNKGKGHCCHVSATRSRASMVTKSEFEHPRGSKGA